MNLLNMFNIKNIFIKKTYSKFNSTNLITSVFILFISILFSACDYKMEQKDSWYAGNRTSIDSLEFRKNHHYWIGESFFTHSPINIVERKFINHMDSDNASFITIPEGNEIIVAEIFISTADSTDINIWTRVIAEDGENGWIREDVMMNRVVPANFISKFIYYFSDKSFLILAIIAIISAIILLIGYHKQKDIKLPLFNDTGSFYPTLLCLVMSTEATIYGTIQRFAEDTWIEYFFQPTLNPFSEGLPFILIVFISGIWLLIILFIAVIEDLSHLFNSTTELVIYLSALMLQCITLYLIFSWSTQIYIGYPLLIIYFFVAISRHIHSSTPNYTCGNCGAYIAKHGECPECGANNVLE